MSEKAIDVAQIMRDIQAEIIPSVLPSQQQALDTLAFHKSELERLLAISESARGNSIPYYDLSQLPSFSGSNGLKRRLLTVLTKIYRRLGMFIIQPQTAVNHNMNTSVNALAESDRELFRTIEAMQAAASATEAKLWAAERRTARLDDELQTLKRQLSSLAAAQKGEKA